MRLNHQTKRIGSVFAPSPDRTSRDHSARPYGNQSRYLAGLVSGIATHNNAVAIAEATARIRKPSQLPSASKRNPVAVVLIEAAMAISVPMNPRTKLNRPVPVVMLKERPPIRGISLPGMPDGSPGMTGQKTEPFVVYEFGDSGSKVYAQE
jgi:hypothetical protein